MTYLTWVWLLRCGYQLSLIDSGAKYINKKIILKTAKMFSSSSNRISCQVLYVFSCKWTFKLKMIYKSFRFFKWYKNLKLFNWNHEIIVGIYFFLHNLAKICKIHIWLSLVYFKSKQTIFCVRLNSGENLHFLVRLILISLVPQMITAGWFPFPIKFPVKKPNLTQNSM